MASSITVFNQIGECTFKVFMNIRDLDINKEYKVKRFNKVKTFGPSVLCHLKEYKVHFPGGFPQC